MGSRLYTRGGDRGRTSLLDGTRVSKDDVRLEAYGTLDEACSLVGAARAHVDEGLLDTPFRGRTALLSPLDRLVFDRTRMSQLFEFDYQLEMYKPAAKRRWGYFALPVLHGDRLVGKVDATTDVGRGVLRVDAVHWDVHPTGAMREGVRRELQSLAGVLGVEESGALP